MVEADSIPLGLLPRLETGQFPDSPLSEQFSQVIGSQSSSGTPFIYIL